MSKNLPRTGRATGWADPNSTAAVAPRVAGEPDLAERRELDAATAVGHVRPGVAEVEHPGAVGRGAALDVHTDRLTRVEHRALRERVPAREAQFVSEQVDRVRRDVGDPHELVPAGARGDLHRPLVRVDAVDEAGVDHPRAQIALRVEQVAAVADAAAGERVLPHAVADAP